MRRFTATPSRRTARAVRVLLACAGAATLSAPCLAQQADAPAASAPVEAGGVIQRAAAAGGAIVLAQPLPNAADGLLSLRLVMTPGASADPIGASGASHVLSHMLWDSAMRDLEERAGREGPDGAAAGLLRALGGRQHAHRAAPLDMFSMSFEMDLSDADDNVRREALRVLSRIATLQNVDERSFANAKETVLQELRGWSSVNLRVNQRATKAIFEPLGVPPGPYVGREDEVAALDLDGVRAVAAPMSARGAVTLVGVGRAVDAPALAREFDPALGERPAFCPVVGPMLPARSRAVVAQDPEFGAGVIETVRVERGDFDERERLLRAAAAEAVRRRIELAAASLTGDDALSELIVLSKPFAPGGMGTPGVHLSVVHAMTARGAWKRGLERAATELRRIESHGLTEGEARLALAKALEPLRRDAADERAGSARDVADRLARLAAQGEPIDDAARDLRDAEAIAAGVSADDLRRAAVRSFLGEGAFAERGFVVVAATGTDERDVTDAAALDAARAVFEGSVAALPAQAVEPARVDRLLDASIDRGSISEVRVDPASAVFTMTLSNGVVAHHRAMGEGSGVVVLEATVGGGEIDEVEGVARGVTDAALCAWREPATRTLSSRELADALAGRNIRVRSWSEQDQVRLSVEAPSEEAEAAARLLAALLLEPKVEPASIEGWKQSATERAAMADRQPFDRLRTRLWTLAEGGGDQRTRFPDGADLSGIDAATAQAWLDGLLAKGGVEVAIVGDLDRAQAARLAETALAAGPAKAALTPARVRDDAPARRVERIDARDAVDSLSSHAAALVGVFAGDMGDADAWAAGELAARVLSPRVRGALAGELSVANEARALWMPMEGWRGFSLLYTPMIASIDRVNETADAAWGEFERLARAAPTQGEFEEAREAARRSIAADLDEPEAWARSLAEAQRRGVGVRALLDRRDAVLRATPEGVRAFLASAVERGRVRTIVTPRRAD